MRPMSNSFGAGAVIYTADIDRLVVFYVTVLGFREAERKPDHVVLETDAFQLVLLRAEGAVAPTGLGAGPSPRRSGAAIKLVFLVSSIAVARAAAPDVGGRVNAPRHEWRFDAHRVCDGVDPDGNVIQLRETWSTTPPRSE
jgi:catechol 2,3-dioxygenase-like lactoylglutathione lyase family enzyme